MFKRELEIIRASKTSSANRKVLMTREQFTRENEDAKKVAKPGEIPTCGSKMESSRIPDSCSN